MPAFDARFEDCRNFKIWEGVSIARHETASGGAVSEYIEIDDPGLIERLTNDLSKRLTSTLLYAEPRIIGYPQGNFPNEVHFLSPTGQDVFYWSSWRSEDNSVVNNVFGHGEPGSRKSLNIDVQVNFPIVEFSRRRGGAFLRHIPTDEVILAHRGIVTLGHGRVAKTDLFPEMVAWVWECQTSRAPLEFLHIEKLQSPTLISKIDAFSSELRRAVKVIATDADQGVKLQSELLGVQPRNRLRPYFEEFSGTQELNGRKHSTADCYHGTVVRKIRDHFDHTTEILKSKVVDLTAILKNRAYLFEVKTSSSLQDIYTAIGQLTVHAPTIAEYAPGRDLVRVMVVPELPIQWLTRLVTDQLGIRLLTFTRSSKGRIVISGLENLT